MDVIDRLREERRKQHLTQADLAERADIMRKHLQRIEVKRTSPTANTLTRIADALGCEITLTAKDAKP